MTAVEWLVKEITDSTMPVRKAIEKAKEMEQMQSHQYAECAVRCDRMEMKILNFEDWIKL